MRRDPFVSAVSGQTVQAHLLSCFEQSCKCAGSVRNSVALEVLLHGDTGKTEQATNKRSQGANKDFAVRCDGQFLQRFVTHLPRI